MTSSTINITIPAANAPVASAPVRDNFTAAASDINALWAAIGTGGVTSFNTLTGAIVLAAGTNVTLTPVGNTITVSVASVSSFSGLTSGTNTTAAMVVGTGASIAATGSGTITATALPVGGITGLGSGVATFLATPTSANLASAMTNETGTGSLVFATSPTLVTPLLGTPTSGILTNCTGTASGLTAGAVSTINGLISQGTNITITGSGTSGSPYVITSTNTAATAFSALTGSTNTSAAMVVGTGASIAASGSGTITATAIAVGGITGLGTGIGTFLAAPSSANLASAMTDETGSGALVFATSPTLVTPLLGTPTSGILTNCTGTASGLTAGHVTTNANLTGVITSSGNATSIASQTGTGTKLVVDTSPTLVTPVLGVATATSVNKVTITAPATGATLTIVDGKTLTSSNTITFTGTDGSSVALGTGGTVAYTSTANTFSGLQTMAAGAYVSAGAIETLVYDNGNSGTSKSINLDNGNWQKVAITGAVAITLTAPTHPGKVTLKATQDATGHIYSIAGVTTAGGAGLTLSTAANKVDIISLLWDGATWFAQAQAGFS